MDVEKKAEVKEKVEHDELKKWEEGTKRGTKKGSRARERGWRRERRSLASGSEGCAPGD